MNITSHSSVTKSIIDLVDAAKKFKMYKIIQRNRSFKVEFKHHRQL